MKITIGKPLSFSEIGRKDNQEDYLKCSGDEKNFVLCDGMGGHENGEVASRIVAETLVAGLEGQNAVEVFDQCLQQAYDALDEADTSDNPRKMGTTMTCVSFGETGVFTAHIGDSRIYHIRPSLAGNGRSGVIYQSEDHSLVNDLLRAGELTAEEAENFPQKNIITRAMQPNGERRCKADKYLITDVQVGDYFFLCCDGVLEQLTNEKLGEILAEETSDEEKLVAIKAVCDDKTRDNYSCWLIPVKNVIQDTASKISTEDLEATVEVDSTQVPSHSEPVAPREKEVSTIPQKRIGFGKLPIFAVILLAAGLCVAGGILLGRESIDDEKATSTAIENTECHERKLQQSTISRKCLESSDNVEQTPPVTPQEDSVKQQSPKKDVAKEKKSAKKSRVVEKITEQIKDKETPTSESTDNSQQNKYEHKQ